MQNSAAVERRELSTPVAKQLSPDAQHLIPWFLLLLTLGLVAVGSGRLMRHVSPIGSTHGFD